MAQRNSPSRRIPDNPLAGILRDLSQRARYSDRRRSSDVPTITSQDVAAGATAGAAPTSQAALAPETVVAPHFVQLELPID